MRHVPDRSLPAIPGYFVRHVELADAPEWAEFAVLPEVKQHTSSEVAGIADLVPMIQRALSKDENAPVLFAVMHVSTNELVATFGFHSISTVNRTAEVTYVVRPAHWGKGLATLACNAAVHWGFQEVAWVRIQATVLEANVPSIRVLQKSGFTLEGRVRNFRMVRGVPRDYLLYSRVPESEPKNAI